MALTKEQQQLVETNHNLIYSFAKKHNLSIDEYYDILAIALCKAAMTVDESKSKFSTYAYFCMNNEIKQQFRYDNAQHRIPTNMLYSYDAEQEDEFDSIGSFVEIIADNHSVHDTVAGNMIVNTLMNLLNDKEKKVVELIMEGKKRFEIANEFCCSTTNISYIIKRIQKKWTPHLANC